MPISGDGALMFPFRIKIQDRAPWRSESEWDHLVDYSFFKHGLWLHMGAAGLLWGNSGSEGSECTTTKHEFKIKHATNPRSLWQCSTAFLHTASLASLLSREHACTPCTVCTARLRNTTGPSWNTGSDSGLWRVTNCSVFLHAQRFRLLTEQDCFIMKTKTFKHLYQSLSAWKNQIATSWILVC